MRTGIGATLAIVVTLLFFQNCSVPTESTFEGASTSPTDQTESASQNLSLKMLSNKIYTRTTTQFIASGGKPPYTYMVTQGSGTVEKTGVYMSGNAADNVTLSVTDTVGSSATLSFPVEASTMHYYLIPVHWSVKSSFNMYTTNYNEAKGTKGFTYKGIVFNVFSSAIKPLAVYRCLNESTGNHFLSNYADCAGSKLISFIGYLEAEATDQVSTPVYRCSKKTGTLIHKITLNQTQCTTNNFKLDGIMGYTQ